MNCHFTVYFPPKNIFLYPEQLLPAVCVLHFAPFFLRHSGNHFENIEMTVSQEKNGFEQRKHYFFGLKRKKILWVSRIREPLSYTEQIPAVKWVFTGDIWKKTRKKKILMDSRNLILKSSIPLSTFWTHYLSKAMATRPSKQKIKL